MSDGSSPVPIYSWVGRDSELRTRPDLEPRPLGLESSALILRPPNLHSLTEAWNVIWFEQKPWIFVKLFVAYAAETETSLDDKKRPFPQNLQKDLMNTLSLVAHFVHVLHDSYFLHRVLSFLPDPNSYIRLWCSWRIHWQLLTPSRPKSPRSHQIRGNTIVSMASLIQ